MTEPLNNNSYHNTDNSEEGEKKKGTCEKGGKHHCMPTAHLKCDFSLTSPYNDPTSYLHRSGHRTGKGQFSFQSQRKAMPKKAQTTTIIFILHTRKVMLKMLQARLQQYTNQEFSDV